MTIFFLRSDEWFYLADIAKILKRAPSSLQRDIKAFVLAGLLETRKESNRIYYRANRQNPILPDLQNLLIKTVGIRNVIMDSLKPILPLINTCFIYGSLARGEEVATSDVDIMMIGPISVQDLAATLPRTEKLLGREINPTIYSQDEFRRKIREQNSFLKTVLADKKIFLRGSEDELQALAG